MGDSCLLKVEKQSHKKKKKKGIFIFLSFSPILCTSLLSLLSNWSLIFLSLFFSLVPK